MKRKSHTISIQDLEGTYGTILAASTVADAGRKKLIAHLKINATGHEIGFIVFNGSEQVCASSRLHQAVRAYNEINEESK